jgi:selenocysteine lyase/cysteine desulfurase
MTDAARTGSLDLDALRRRIPGVEATAYLNTGGFGLMPDVARQELIQGYADLATKIDPMAWYARCHEQEGPLRARIGRFVGADADEIALKISLSDGYGSVLWGLDWRPGERVIVTDEEHPSPRLAVELAARQFALEVVTLPIRPLDRFTEALRAELGRGARLVALSHVTTDSGTVLPAREIVRLARDAGALSLFDGAQALGQGPVDLHDLGCDFYAAMGYKWLLGPSGTGLLYARRASQGQLRSVIGSGSVRWLDLPRGRYEEDEGAARFEFAARAWPQYFARLETVTGRDLTGRLRSDWNIVQRAAMMVGPEGGVRISLACYTSEHEVDLLARAVREIAASG